MLESITSEIVEVFSLNFFMRPVITARVISSSWNWFCTRTCGAGRPHVWLCHALLVLCFIARFILLVIAPLSCCQCKASTVRRRRSGRHVRCRRRSSSGALCTAACGSVAASCATTATSDVSPTSLHTWTSSAPADDRAVSASRTLCWIAPIHARRTSRRTFSSATTAWQVRCSYTSSLL